MTCRRLANSLGAGLPPAQALHLIAETGGITGAAASAAAIERGEPLHRALARAVTLTPEHSLAIAAGEQSGRTSAVLNHLADDLESAIADRRAWLTLSAYPIFLLHVVVPLTSTSLLLQDPWRFVTRTAIALAALWTTLLATVGLSRFLRKRRSGVRFLLRLPLVGRAVSLAAQVHFLRSLGVLYGSGIRFDRAWTQATAALGTATPFDDLERAAALARSGEPMTRCIAALDHFDPLDRGELATGAQIGELEPAIRRVLARLEERWRATTRRIAVGIGALLYVIAATAVAIAVIGYWSNYVAQLDLPR